MSRKKNNPYLFPVLLVLGIIIFAYALITYANNPVNDSTEWDLIIPVIAGAIGYFFVLGLCFYGLTQTKTKNPLAIILIWGFLGIVTSEFLGFLYDENLFSSFGYGLIEMQILIIIMCVFFGIMMSVLKRR